MLKMILAMPIKIGQHHKRAN